MKVHPAQYLLPLVGRVWTLSLARDGRVGGAIAHVGAGGSVVNRDAGEHRARHLAAEVRRAANTGSLPAGKHWL